MKTIKNLLVLLFLVFLTSCGVNEHTHSHDGSYHSSETEHWLECECGHKENEESHFGGVATCKFKAFCEKCGEAYGDFIECNFILKKDAEKHWYECNVCNLIKDEASHSLEMKYNSEVHWLECDCGYKEDEINHTLEVNYDNEAHWLECDCGLEKEKLNHNYDNGKITVEATDTTKGTKVYSCLGCDHKKESSINEIEGYEVDQYPQLTNADVIYYEGSIYTYGGNGNGRTNSIYRYSVSNDKLYELDVKLEIESTSHRVILVGSKVYIFGGLGNKSVRPTGIYVHDLERQTLEKLETEFPFGMNCFQVGYYGNTIYIIGGSGIIGNFADVYAFDLETHQTTKLDAKLPTTVFKGAWCTVDKYAYVIGGTNGSRLTSIYRFDMETHEVLEMNAKLPDNVSQSRAVYDGEGNIYIYGGTIDETTQHYWGLVDYVVKYNIESDTAEFTSYKLPQVLANVCAVKTDEGIYILGGDNDYTDIIIKHVGDEITYVRTPKSLITEE